MKHLLIGAAAAMAFVGVAASGSAQTQDDKGKSPAAESKSQGPSTPTPETTDPKAEPRKGVEQGPGKEPKSTQQKGRDQQQRQSQGQPKGPETDRKATEQRQPGKGEPKATEKRDPNKDQPKSTEQRRPEKDQPKSTEQREPKKDQPKSTEQRDPAKDKQKSTQGQTDQKQANRVQVTEEKRSGVRDRLIKERKVQRTKINVSINIGTTLPRSVRLHRLPTTVVSFEPAYRGYSYVLLENETIVIVDERTYVIVDVIPAGTQRADRPNRTQLSLSPGQMRLIYSRVPKDRIANVRVRLALGAEVPRDVELLEFPSDVVDQIPDVRRYRFLVTGNDVVIVDPNDHAVALVINE